MRKFVKLIPELFEILEHKIEIWYFQFNLWSSCSNECGLEPLLFAIVLIFSSERIFFKFIQLASN